MAELAGWCGAARDRVRTSVCRNQLVDDKQLHVYIYQHVQMFTHKSSQKQPTGDFAEDYLTKHGPFEVSVLLPNPWASRFNRWVSWYLVVTLLDQWWTRNKLRDESKTCDYDIDTPTSLKYVCCLTSNWRKKMPRKTKRGPRHRVKFLDDKSDLQ